MKNYNIAVIGAVGVGKSTVAAAIAEKLNRPIIPENYRRNPYLDDQESHMFSLQWEMMNILLDSHKLLGDHFPNGIIDRTLYETYEVFTRQHKDKLTPQEQEALRIRYRSIEHSIRIPDLIIHLKCPAIVAWKRIAERGRDFELNQYDLAYCEEQEFLYGGLSVILGKRTTVYELETEQTKEQVITSAIQKIRCFERRFSPRKKKTQASQ